VDYLACRYAPSKYTVRACMLLPVALACITHQNLVQRYVICMASVSREEGQRQGGSQPQKMRGMGL